MDVDRQSNMDDLETTEDDQVPQNTLQDERIVKPGISDQKRFFEQKWKRLRRHRHQRYEKLFVKSYEHDADTEFLQDFSTTQLGAVTWTPYEKTNFFKGLSRKGRHDLPGISTIVGTKSVVEIKDYLDILEQEKADRQYIGHSITKMTYAEIPAAIEIGEDCERLLEGAADALNGFEEQYDSIVGHRPEGLPFYVDEDTASKLDEEYHRNEDYRQESNNEHLGGPTDIKSFFDLPKLLYLSKYYFMHRGQNQQYQPWYELAEEGQGPAMTSATVEELYNIIKTLIGRLIQTCMFIAQTRIRSTTTQQHEPVQVIKASDIALAVGFLGLKEDSRKYWINVARRNQLAVFRGSHRQNRDKLPFLSYDEVEGILESTSLLKQNHTKPEKSKEPHDERSDSGESFESEEETEPEIDTPTNLQTETSAPVNSVASKLVNEPHPSMTKPKMKMEEIVMTAFDLTPVEKPLEDDSDDSEDLENGYLEELDQEARVAEESRIYQFLEIDPVQHIGVPTSIVNNNRKRPLKVIEDSIVWSGVFEAEWEQSGEALAANRSSNESRSFKRMKTIP